MKNSQVGNIDSALSLLGGSVRRASQKPDVEVIPTDIPELNEIVFGCGGLPRGRAIEVYAPESVGKSTLCYWLIAQVQKRGGTAVLFDAEGTYVNNYAAQLGVDNDALALPEFTTAEDCAFKVKKLIAANAVDLIVIDSVPALQPSKNTDLKDDSNRSMNEKLARASFLTDFSNDLQGGYRVNMHGDHESEKGEKKKRAKYIKDPDTGNDYHKLQYKKTCLIFINHAKDKVGVMFGDPTTTPGGRSLKFLCSIRLGMEYWKKSKQKNETNQPVYKLIRVVAAKNKLAPPLNRIALKLETGGSISYFGDDILEDEGDDDDE